MRTRIQKWGNSLGLRISRRCFVVLISHVFPALSFPLGAAERIDSGKAVVEDRSYSDAFLVTSKQQSNANNRAALRAAYNRLLEAGTSELHYLPGERLLSEDGEGTVDSSHPTDLGFVQQADAMEVPLRALLKQAR